MPGLSWPAFYLMFLTGIEPLDMGLEDHWLNSDGLQDWYKTVYKEQKLKCMPLVWISIFKPQHHDVSVSYKA